MLVLVNRPWTSLSTSWSSLSSFLIMCPRTWRHHSSPPGVISDHALVTCQLPISADLPPLTDRLVRSWQRIDRDHYISMIMLWPCVYLPVHHKLVYWIETDKWILLSFGTEAYHTFCWTVMSSKIWIIPFGTLSQMLDIFSIAYWLSQLLSTLFNWWLSLFCHTKHLPLCTTWWAWCSLSHKLICNSQDLHIAICSRVTRLMMMMTTKSSILWKKKLVLTDIQWL